MISPQLTVQCHGKKTAPCRMTRGSATSDSLFSYFTPSNSTSVYRYEYVADKWEELPSCPYKNTGLVIVDRELTAVGGYNGSYRHTNKLCTLQQREWVEKYPPMNIARYSSAVVHTPDGEYLIVMGGRVDSWTTTVELFQVKSRKWYKVTDLPQPLLLPSATICGDVLHVNGGDTKGYSYSLQALLHCHKPSIPRPLSWAPLPPLPVTHSTAATLRGQLVLLGGTQGGLFGTAVNSIYQLVHGQWVKIGSMPKCRTNCLVVSQSPDKIIIVGGSGAVDSVEEYVVCSLVL